jgi:hypothetical protein
VETLERRVADLCRLAGAKPVAVAHDLHPGTSGPICAAAGPSPSRCSTITRTPRRASPSTGLARLARPTAGLGVDGTIWGGSCSRSTGALRSDRISRRCRSPEATPRRGSPGGWRRSGSGARFPGARRTRTGAPGRTRARCASFSRWRIGACGAPSPRRRDVSSMPWRRSWTLATA